MTSEITGVKTPLPSVHFIGIGGIGVSSLARWFLAQNWSVSGSDAAESQITSELEKDGVRVKIGHSRANLPQNLGLAVYSQAIKPENPEIEAAKALGVPLLSYPQMVGRLTGSYKTICIAGAHGKSTTTSLMALILGRADFDPTVIVGTKLSEFGGKNFRFGEGPYLILEADEYGRAFLNYTPSHVIVTNIDCEHLDIYKDIDEIKNTFLAFLKNTARGGVLVLNRDNPELASLSEEIEKIASEGGLEILWFSVSQSEAKKVKKALKIPGMHNLSNALAAFTLAKKLGVEEETILAAISGFRGAWRRMEYRGDIKAGQRKIPVYDDYAHHPTEIKASLSGFREKYPGARIVCVFQPHQAKRLQALFAEFAAAFEDADEVIILPLYAVAGRDSTPLLDSEKLAAAILQKYPEKNISYLPTCENLKELILDSLEKTNGDAVVVMMGAGDIFLRTQDLI